MGLVFIVNMNWYDACHDAPVCSCMYRGSLIGHPVEHLRVVLTDGASHAVDSSELAFKLASIYAFRQVILVACVQGVILCKMNLFCLSMLWPILTFLNIISTYC
jgi:hypothetical protein